MLSRGHQDRAERDIENATFTEQIACGSAPRSRLCSIWFKRILLQLTGGRIFDNSPTLRIERIPIVGKILGRISGNGQRFPSDVRYGDICKGLPVVDGTVKGAYASHVLEHLSLEDFRVALVNTYRMLEPAGRFRLIVPDLEARARIYLEGA